MGSGVIERLIERHFAHARGLQHFGAVRVAEDAWFLAAGAQGIGDFGGPPMGMDVDHGGFLPGCPKLNRMAAHRKSGPPSVWVAWHPAARNPNASGLLTIIPTSRYKSFYEHRCSRQAAHSFSAAKAARRRAVGHSRQGLCGDDD